MVRKEIVSYTGTYKMTTKAGTVIVQGTEKFKHFVGIFNLSDVKELLEGVI